MQDQDSVDPGDAALQELIASVADYIDDPVKKELLLDFLTIMRPMAEWSEGELELLTQTCAYVISLARLNRDLKQLNGHSAPGTSPTNPQIISKRAPLTARPADNHQLRQFELCALTAGRCRTATPG